MKKTDSKIKTLPGQKTLPASVLSNLMDQVEDMEEIVAVVHWTDNTVSMALNDMDLASLCVMHKFLGVEIDRILRGET